MGTRSLPTNSPVPYFQPIERGHMSEGGLSDRYSPKAIFVGGIQTLSHDGNIPLGGTNYPPIAAEPGIYTGLHDDYDTLFEARHGRGAMDPISQSKGTYSSRYRSLQNGTSGCISQLRSHNW